jgi:hypothetical protein
VVEPSWMQQQLLLREVLPVLDCNNFSPDPMIDFFSSLVKFLLLYMYSIW